MSSDTGKSDHDASRGGGVSRREFLKIVGLTGAAVGLGAGLGGLAAACGEDADSTATTASGTSVSTSAERGRDIKFGVVCPQTGPLAPFASGVNWSMERVSQYLPQGIVTGDGIQRKITFIKKDTQSDTNRAATITGDLIQTDNVDIVLSSGGPDTVNPAADVCESMGCPSLCSASVWQAFYYDRKPPQEGFKWTYGSLLGSEQSIANFAQMFDQIPNNKIVGMLLPNDADAAGWMKPEAAPAVFKSKGYTLIEPSWYTSGAEDYTTQISEFKKAGCEIICGTNTAPDFTNFWKQAIQQGFRPKLVSTGRALLYPEALEAIGPVGYGLIGEVGWHRSFPYKDSITGQTAEDLALDYEAKTGRASNTGITGMYQVIEWAIDVFKRATKPEDKESVVKAITSTKMVTTCGGIDFTAKVDPDGWRPVPNVVRTVLCGGQWVKGTKYQFANVICSNAWAPEVTVQRKVEPMKYTS
ncbi:MAG: ABC transporter substrate-binding protein [Thermoleophilia bacterium]|jgi:branched-chain amino acid transport system substrate-binding protein